MPESLGAPIARLTDASGEVCVHAQGRLRSLTLGNQVQQSCIDLDRPARLVHGYTQAMMLGLLLAPVPSRALLLGLGGGALAQALLACDDSLVVDAVEARPAVVEAARNHLALPESPRLQVHLCDANTFVRGQGSSYDLVFLDLYCAEGMHPDQGTLEFLTACRARLNPQGVMVSNQWSGDFRDSRRVHAALDTVFPGRVLYLHIQGGNAIAFAFASALPNIRRNALFTAAQSLAMRLDIPLQRLARALWTENGAAFQGGSSGPAIGGGQEHLPET